jgi:hypothetical protein
VVNKSGVLDIERMTPFLPNGPTTEISILAEIGVKACKDALARAGQTALMSTGDRRRLQPAARLSRHGDRNPGRAWALKTDLALT